MLRSLVWTYFFNNNEINWSRKYSLLISISGLVILNAMFYSVLDLEEYKQNKIAYSLLIRIFPLEVNKFSNAFLLFPIEMAARVPWSAKKFLCQQINLLFLPNTTAQSQMLSSKHNAKALFWCLICYCLRFRKY